MTSNLVDNNYEELVMAVVKQAVDDYIVALTSKKRNEYTIKEVENFLCKSDLVSFTKLNGEDIIKQLKAMYE